MPGTNGIVVQTEKPAKPAKTGDMPTTYWMNQRAAKAQSPLSRIVNSP